MKKMKLTVFNDPAHGWLKVSQKQYREIMGNQMPSRFSYAKGEFFFLEEDCDMQYFWEEAKKQGYEISLVQKTSSKMSKIRNYEVPECFLTFEQMRARFQ